MNPFANLIDPGAGVSAHKELSGRLKRSREAPPPDDEAEDEPQAGDALTFEVTSSRTYRPKGLTLALLRLLQDGNSWTAAELSSGIDRDRKEISSLLDTPVRHGIVRKLNTSPLMWELA